MLYQCGIETSDDNGEAEVGDAAYYFPKLNSSASLYDKFNLRAHTEVSSPDDLLSTAMDHNQAAFGTQADSSAEVIGQCSNSRTLLSAAYNTPLLATTAATEASAEPQHLAEMTNTIQQQTMAWGLVSTTSAGPACTYYRLS